MPDKRLSRDEFAAAALIGRVSKHYSYGDAVGGAFAIADLCLASSAPGVVEALRDLVDAIEGHPDKPHSQAAMETAKQVLARYDQHPPGV